MTRSALSARLLCALLALQLANLSCGSSSGSGGVATGGLAVGRLGEIRVKRAGAATGRGVAEVVLPLAPGRASSVAGVQTAGGQVCQARPMGARHADGSLRMVRLEVPVDAASGRAQVIELHGTATTPPGFSWHPAVRGPGLVEAGSVRLRAGSTTVAFPAPTLLEGGPVSETWRSRLRVPGTMLWGELTVSFYADLPHAKFTLQWGISDSRTAALYEDPGAVEFMVDGPRVEIESRAAKVLAAPGAWPATRLLLHRAGGKIADGQSQLIEGRLVFAGSAPPRFDAIALGWPASGSFGPFGIVLEEFVPTADAFAELVAKERAAHVDDPWARPVHGCNPSPSNTGSQADFGTVVLRADVLRADPARLRTVLRSVYQEACRPTHHRETDVRRVTVENHPRWMTLSGRSKYDNSDSDLLGKPKKTWPTEMMRSPEGSRWLGHDRQHLSINYLAATAMLTGNRFAREEVDHHCELYLSGFTYESGFFNDSPGASRTVGRSSLAAIWMWLVSGRDEIRERLENRTRALAAHIAGHGVGLDVIKPRVDNTRWYAWEEAVGATGVAAVYHRFRVPEALAIVRQLTRTVAMHGFGQLADGRWRVGYHLPLRDAAGRPYVATADPDFAAKAAGSGLTRWALPALFLAVQHANDAGVRKTARSILQAELAGPVAGLDDLFRWICVTPDVAAIAALTPK